MWPHDYLWDVLKQMTVIWLLIGILGQTFNKGLISLQYQLNKNFIAANLCENRARPEMKCEGKCYLCKRLKNEEKKDQENPERRAENRFESLPFPLGFSLTHPTGTTISLEYPSFQEEVNNSFVLSLFHPPQV
jgi:hypothetical protein